MADNIFLQFTVLLGVVVFISLIMRLLRQPLIVAYLLAGTIIGPIFLIAGEPIYESFAKFGIILLLFIVGLSVNVNFFKRVGKAAILAGLGQFFFTGLAGLIILTAFNFPLIPSLFIAIAITFSSTVVVTKLLADKGDMESVYGRFLLGLLIVQDVIAISVMLVLTNLGQEGAWYVTASLILLRALALIGIVFLLARYVLPFIMDRIARSGELLFIFTIAWCFAIASLVHAVGFSLEIGAIIAGISLGASPYQMEISSRVKPLRDFFLILFFIVLGSELAIGSLPVIIKPATILILFIILIQPIILFLILRWLKFTKRDSFLSGFAAAQVSEFGFIVVFKGYELGHVGSNDLALITAVAMITIIISSYLITYNEQIYQKLRPYTKWMGKDHHVPKALIKKRYKIWIFGYHRIGWKVGEALTKKRIPFAVVDFNPSIVRSLHAKGIPAFFGDAADLEFLKELHLNEAKMVISTIPQHDDNVTLVKYVRRRSKRASIVVCSYDIQGSDLLYKAGADYVVLPSLLGGQYLGELLKKKQWSRGTFDELHKQQKLELKHL